MEEKQEQKQEPELKGKIGIVWLTGILVILLGCVTVYTLKLAKENGDLKQSCKGMQQPPVVTTVPQATKTEETAKVKNETVEEKIEDNTTTESTTYSFKKLEGIYENTEDIKISGEKTKETEYLELYKDGTYRYIYSNELVGVPDGTIGNYTIEGNKIILNSWFTTGSDISLTVKNEKKTYNITKNAIGKMKKTNKKSDYKNVIQEVKGSASQKAIFVN